MTPAAATAAKVVPMEAITIGIVLLAATAACRPTSDPNGDEHIHLRADQFGRVGKNGAWLLLNIRRSD
jgi:hypothetical protein